MPVPIGIGVHFKEGKEAEAKQLLLKKLKKLGIDNFTLKNIRAYDPIAKEVIHRIDALYA